MGIIIDKFPTKLIMHNLYPILAELILLVCNFKANSPEHKPTNCKSYSNHGRNNTISI